MSIGLPQSSRTLNWDVIVVGSGLAGLAAGLEASGAGVKTLMLEKTDEASCGGNSRLAGGAIAVPRGSDAVSIGNYVEDFMAKAGGRCNRAIVETLANNALADLDWMGSLGADFDPSTPNLPYRVDAAHVSPAQFLGMPLMLRALRSRFVSMGGHVAFETKARQLILNEKGNVCGVRVIDRTGVVDHLADAVVIATGGYTGNRELLESFVDPNAGGMSVRGVHWATGDGLLMAREIGAGLTHMGGLASLHVAAVHPTQPAQGIPDRSVPYCVSINLEGRRFHDEAQGYVANGKAILKQPGQRIALVFDEVISKEHRLGISIATYKRLGIPLIEANSLEDLATQMGMPVPQFEQTIAEYNAAISNQQALSVSPPKTALALPIQSPKFYAFFPLIPGVTSCFGGVLTDERSRACEADGRIIHGLFVAGEAMGGVFYDDYIGGSALANCIVMGRVAGKEATRRAIDKGLG